MRRSSLLSLILLPVVILANSFQGVSALSGSQFNAARIMDDIVFFNGNALTASQIQSFLNSKVPACDTNHTQSSSSNDSGPPYTCLKDYSMSTPNKAADSYCNSYSGGTKSAAQIIYDVGKACGVSQKALVVMLQKEQGLVTDTWPWDIQYKKAMGFGCPDTAPCDSQYYGFFNQVYMAARQFKKYQANPQNYNFRAGFTSNVLYNPNTACGSHSVTMANSTTAGLYNYTPYQPNAAALNNLYGNGDSCSAYGNRNFWRYYNDWFGSTYTNTAYAATLESLGVYTSSAKTQVFTKDKISLQPGEKAYITIKLRNVGWKNWDQSFTRIGIQGDDASAFEDASWFKPNRPAQMEESTVTPGEIGTFEFVLNAPNSLTGYEAHYQPLIENKVWLSPNLRFIINVTNPTTAKNTDYRLTSGQQINANENMVSRDLQNTLLLQSDGNLVLYSAFDARWSTRTYNKPAQRLVMQPDGNLVLYDDKGKALWNTGTQGNSGAYFAMQTDGNMVVYSSGGTALWNSGTVERPDDLLHYVSPTLYDENFILKGQQLETANRKFRMAFQGDGNLVIYSNDTGKPLWASNTGAGAYKLIMQHDGNLVIYDKEHRALWNTHTAGHGYSRLVMQQDGNLVIYDQLQKPSWNSGTKQ